MVRFLKKEIKLWITWWSNKNQINFSGDLYTSCKEFLILKGLFDEDDEYLDNYSGINTRRNQDTKDMFDGNRKYVRVRPGITRFGLSTECNISIFGGRYGKHYINTLQGEHGFAVRVGKKVKSVENSNNCCWKVFNRYKWINTFLYQRNTCKNFYFQVLDIIKKEDQDFKFKEERS